MADAVQLNLGLEARLSLMLRGYCPLLAVPEMKGVAGLLGPGDPIVLPPNRTRPLCPGQALRFQIVEETGGPGHRPIGEIGSPIQGI